MRASICVGDYAKTPYVIEELDLRVYSMEELCYCLRENAFLLDISLMKDGLVNWIGKECGLSQLAHILHPMIHKQGSLSAFVLAIMEYTGLYDGNVLGQVEQVLKKGSGLSNIERRKSQVDFLIGKKKYVAAIRGYDDLLDRWQEDERKGRRVPGSKTYADILHNKGVALCGMMRYEEGFRCFKEAYTVCQEAVYLRAMLIAQRMQLNDKEYVAFTQQYPECYELSLHLEKELEECRELWQQQPEFVRLEERKAYRQGNESRKYYEENDRITKMIKNQYRFTISE